MPRLLHELAVSRGDGSYACLLVRLAKLDLLAIEDWPLALLTAAERRDLLEVIEDRSERAATLIASQLPAYSSSAVITRLLSNWNCCSGVASLGQASDGSTRLFEMVKGRGYPCSVVQLRRAVRLIRRAAPPRRSIAV